MKYQSEKNKNIFFEYLQNTPISYLDPLWLQSIFNWKCNTYFFFEGWKKNKVRRCRVNFYLKISGRDAYRIMQEDEAYSSVWRYLGTKDPHWRPNKKGRCGVYRLYGTPYIKEMNKSGTYSNYKKDIDNKVFQIMIITEDETIEIVNPQEMEWVKYNYKNLKQTLINLIKK